MNTKKKNDLYPGFWHSCWYHMTQTTWPHPCRSNSHGDGPPKWHCSPAGQCVLPPIHNMDLESKSDWAYMPEKRGDPWSSVGMGGGGVVLLCETVYGRGGNARTQCFSLEQCCGWSAYNRRYQFHLQSTSVCRTSTNWASVGSSRSSGSLPLNRGPAGSRAADIIKVQLITTLSIEQHSGALYSLLIWLYSRISSVMVLITSQYISVLSK